MILCKAFRTRIEELKTSLAQDRGGTRVQFAVQQTFHRTERHQSVFGDIITSIVMWTLFSLVDVTGFK